MSASLSRRAASLAVLSALVVGGARFQAASATAPITQVDDAAFAYTGTWGRGTASGPYLGDERFSNVAGSTYSLTFTGTQARLYGSLWNSHGR
ncbi:MAG: hypothetical protein ACRD0F_02740, partial [Acidimicrobiales bacterium]